MFNIIHRNLINAATKHKTALSNGNTTENISSVLISQTQQLNAGPTGIHFAVGPATVGYPNLLVLYHRGPSTQE